MKNTLTFRDVTKLLSGLISVGLLLFLPAGTWYYSGAWLFIAMPVAPGSIDSIGTGISLAMLLGIAIGSSMEKEGKE